MNNKKRESLSAYFDGEMSDPEAIETLLGQNECHKDFAALCQQRDALQGQLNPHLPHDFAQRVALAIADEPTVLSPAAARKSARFSPDITTNQSTVVRGWFGGRAPSLAVAASVAAIGFVGLVALNEGKKKDTELVAVAPASVSSASSTQLAIVPNLSVRQEAVRPVTADFRSIDLNSLAPQLRAQLVQHMEAMRASEQAVGGAQSSNLRYQSGN